MKVPKYSKHKATGQAYVTVDKRRHYLGKYGTPESEERYRRFVQQYTSAPVNPRATTKAPGAEFEVIELCGAYWLHAEKYYGSSPESLDRVKAAIRVLKLTHASTPIREFGPLALQAIQHDLAVKGRARSYVNHLVGAIKRVFRWGVTQEIVPVTVYQALATVPGLRKGRSEAVEPAPIEPVPDHVVDETLPELQPIVADMVMLQRLTGCRPGEVVLVRPVDVDRSAEVWEYRPKRHKSAYRGASRVIFIGPRAQNILRPYLLRPTGSYCFSPTETKDNLNALRREQCKSVMTPSQRARRRKRSPQRAPGECYTTNTYRQQIHRTIKRINAKRLREAKRCGLSIEDVQLIPHWSPNQLRHAAGTEVRKAFGIEAAQVTLGHAKADVTQVYAERDYELARKVAERIG